MMICGGKFEINEKTRFSHSRSCLTYPIKGVLRFKNPFNFLLILFVPACCCCCCCCCFCCSKRSCSCCWLSKSCWNFKLPLLVSFSSVGSTNSSCDLLWRHQKYAAAKRIRINVMIPSVERTPINIMRPKSAFFEIESNFKLKLF